MNRRAALAVSAVTLAFAGCRPGEPIRVPPPAAPPPVGLPRTEPLVRVGLAVDSATVTVGAQGAFEVVAPDGRRIASQAATTWAVTPVAGGALDARSSTGESVSGATLRLIPTNGVAVVVGGRSYRGELLLRTGTRGGVTAVNVVDLEQYLLGVVPREMGRRPASEIEALKAQAVAARTYAIGNLSGRAAAGFDFYATVLDQVYGGLADEDTIVSRAVRETRGEIVSYDGLPILAYYSSTCGGQTAAIEQSWPWRAPLPYLKSVSDRIPGSDSSYCSTSSRYAWSAKWTRAELLGILGETLRAHTGHDIADPKAVTTMRVTQTNGAGRITLDVGVDGTVYTLRDDSVRWVLRPPTANSPLLNSSRIYDVKMTNINGQITDLEMHGGGWGHGVGMCQVGAMGRARAGQRYDQILKAYYTGTEIQRLY